MRNALQGLPGGKMGKLRVHASGRISVCVGGVDGVGEVCVSLPVRYEEEVATIAEGVGAVNVLGAVRHRLCVRVCLCGE